MKKTIIKMLAPVTLLGLLAGCATTPQEQDELCMNCGEVTQVSESDTTAESFSNDNLTMADQTTASALASFNSVGTTGIANRQSSLTSGPGMQLRRPESSYDVVVRMASGERRIVQLPRSIAGRWQVGDKVKVMGNSLVRQ